jgi:hypothetical protein
MKTSAFLRRSALMISVGLLFTGGCVVQEAGPARLPADQLDPNNGGLQSKDVQAATDQMATTLLSLPKLNASDHKWTIVVSDTVNQTTDPYSLQFNVFSNRLKAVIFQKSEGRVQLIDNKDAYHAAQNSELENTQGGHPMGVQPDYDLRLTINEMPNRSTSLFQVNGSLLDLSSRTIVWQDLYEIQAER